MTRSTPRSIAAILLTIGALLAATIAFGLVVARAVVDGGRFEVTPDEAQLVADLGAVAPFIAAFGLASLLAAIGILFDRSWSTVVAVSVSTVAVVASTIGVTVLILGGDPFAHLSSNRAIDGITTVASVAIYHAVVLTFLALGRVATVGRPTVAAAA